MPPDAPDASDPGLAAGTALAHYVVGRRIGSGAMGTVYEAHDTALDRTVAVKVVNPELASDPEMVERFGREARAAARANHDNLTHIYFVGRAGDRPFFAMEHVPGENLEDRVARTGPLPLAEAIDALVQAARGLAAAHAVGVVHRDVKPSNVIRMPDGRVKVTDFGLAKSGGGDPSASAVGRLTGTPDYMSPEQCRADGVDARSDIYSLGLTAWFLLAGRPAYRAPSVVAVLGDQMHTPLPPLAAVRDDLPPAVDAVLARLCAKDPAARPASMEEVARLLEPLRPRTLRLAPFAARGSALAIDVLLLSMAAAALTFVGAHVEPYVGAAALEVLGVVVFGALLALALPWLEWRYGVSPGKHLLGLRVVRDDGGAPGWPAVLERLLLRFPSLPTWTLPDGWAGAPVVEAVVRWSQLAAVIAGAATWPFAGRRTLSDVLTRTRVVLDEVPLPPPPPTSRGGPPRPPP